MSSESLDIRMSDFCRSRQTAKSALSWSSDMDGIPDMVRANWHRAMPTYRKQSSTGPELLHGGVVEVPVPADSFMTPIQDLVPGDYVVGMYTARSKGEQPRFSFFKRGEHKAAVSATAICYHREVLAETHPDQPEGDYWEVIALNASPLPSGVVVPIDPWTLCHNHFQTDGGTASGMTDAEFAATLRTSFLFWKDRVKTKPQGA